jgi:hypothetical protein
MVDLYHITRALTDARYLWTVMREGVTAVKIAHRWDKRTGSQRLEAVLSNYHAEHATGCATNPEACTTEVVRAVNRQAGATVALLFGVAFCLYRWTFCASWWLPDV